MAQATMEPLATDVEGAIEAELRKTLELRSAGVVSASLRAPALAMPDYVEHRNGATEIGKLSAEAIVREYEVAAKEIEAMGTQLIERVKQCETMTHDALIVTEELKEIAARYREEAKRVFAEIENCSQATAEVRKTCTELREKITVPATTDKLKEKKK
jgi:hypothetical protein